MDSGLRLATTSYIIGRALSRIAVLRIGKTATAIQAQDGLNAVNEMLLGLQADGIYISPLIPIPDKHTPGLIAMLAIKLAPDYGIEPSPLLIQEAKDGMKALLAAYVYAPDAQFDPAVRNLPSQRLMGQRGVPFATASITPSSAPSVTGFCVLVQGSPTSTFLDSNCLTTSTITLTPYSRSAQEEWDFVRPIVAAGPLAGQFTVTHQNNAISDRTFEYLIVI